MANEWIGAAVTASLVSGLVTALGWWASHHNSVRLDGLRRIEKIRDYKSALAAEITANLDRFSDVDLATHRAEMVRRIEASGETTPSFTPFVPRYATTIVFDRLLTEIALLPNEAIEAVVLYYKGRAHALPLRRRSAQRSLRRTTGRDQGPRLCRLCSDHRRDQRQGRTCSRRPEGIGRGSMMRSRISIRAWVRASDGLLASFPTKIPFPSPGDK
jgi:hypothetical protein